MEFKIIAVRKIYYRAKVEVSSLTMAKIMLAALLDDEKTGENCDLRDILHNGDLVTDSITSAKIIT